MSGPMRRSGGKSAIRDSRQRAKQELKRQEGRHSRLRRTPLVRKPKAKGTAYEKRIQEILRDHGYLKAKRNLGSGSQGGGDLIEAIPGYSIECKKVEHLNLWKALAQSEAAASPTETPLVVFARNRSRDYVAMPLEDFLGVLKEQESLRESALF